MYKKMTALIFSIALLLVSSVTLPNQELIHQGRIALQQKDQATARHRFGQLLAIDPDNYEAHYYLAITEYYAGNSHQATEHILICLAMRATDPQLMQIAATICNSSGDFATALKLFEDLYEQNPTNQTCITKLLPIYLRNMDWYYAEKLCRVHDLWWYNYDLSHKTVLLDLSSEWNGLGDVLQIVRYAQHLHDAGARVTVQARKELLPLLANCPYIATLLPAGIEKPITDHTYQLTTDRCVLRMKNLMYAPSKEVPYIFADQKRIERWAPFFKNSSKLNIGICFQSTKMRDYFTDAIMPGPRAFAAELLKPLLAIKEITFYSLQKGEDAAIAQLKKEGFNIITFGTFDADGPFTDTAAIMKNLDLVITVDTSIAHLAGALGVPVWVMLPHAADFRWFNDRCDSPLYPTMRLFRQKKHGDWLPVIAHIAELLAL